MTHIDFVAPFRPIMCGIADYTSFIAEQLPAGEWGILSFAPQTYGAQLTGDHTLQDSRVWYGIPGRDEFSASQIQNGLQQLGHSRNGAVLWFQHEHGIWLHRNKFVSMLRDLNMPKIVTIHTLHFQSPETPSGLTEYEYNLLRNLLQTVDAITVFSHGVHSAVTSAFPEYHERVHVVKHGVHTYPDIARMTRREAKERLHDFLIYESDLPQKTKKSLRKQRTFLDPQTVVIGQTGFLCPMKGSEALYLVRDELQDAIPSKRIAAVRIGSPRDRGQNIYAHNLRQQHNGKDKFLLKTWLPLKMLPVAQKAFDINFYWPKDCTQSGILAHALGAGAVVIGRDMEGVGETLKEVGAPTAMHLQELVEKAKWLILRPELTDIMEQKALKYAADFSWKNQALRHCALASRAAAAHAKAVVLPAPQDRYRGIIPHYQWPESALVVLS